MKEHILVEKLSQLLALTASEKADIEQSFPIKTFVRGTHLLKAGQIARAGYFIIEGCVREYKLVDGEEKITAFYTENESVLDFSSMKNKIPAKVNFVCVEDTIVAIVNAEKEEELYRKHPRFESFCRDGMEQMMGEKQDQLSELITLKPEQRYQKLQAERPGLINRVPQYQIASYLGAKPESLSRIRARLALKSKS